MGSVKDLTVEKEAGKQKLGTGAFIFSDRYSVFDWGEMPDLIPGKGEALAMMGGYNFELLEGRGIKSHYRGLVEEGDLREVGQLDSPSKVMAVALAHKPSVEGGGKGYQYPDLSERKNFLIPLEVVFRNYVPVGSSLRRRREPDELGLEYSDWPESEIELETPLIEFSTKLERQDRYLSEEEAWRISGLKGKKFEELKDVAARVNRFLTDHALERGFDHLDGKIECIYDRGEVVVADVVGTFDENRFSYADQQISKEVLRQWYKKEDEKWYQELTAAKEESLQGGPTDWRELVDRRPRTLDPSLKELVSDLYRAGANKWMEREVFEVADVSQVLEGLKEWKKKTNL